MDAVYKLDGVAIGGISACVPCRVVDNFEFGRELYGKDLEATIKVTGVERRRFVPEGEPVTALDLCVKAAVALRNYAGFDYSDFGGLIFVTMTPDFLMPNNASYAHKLLGLPQNTPAFDIGMACSGYPYGLWIAGMAAKSANRRVLLLDGDTHSPFISPYDRSTSLLFGDGGSATVLEPSGTGGWCFDFVTIGDRESLVVPDGGYRGRVSAASAEYDEYKDGSRRRRVDLRMDGMSVFNSVVRNAPPSLTRLMSSDGRVSDDYDYLLLHQANLMMINQVAKKLKFSGERFPTSIAKYGNIGSGSIALNLCSELRGVVEDKKSRVLMSAFGAGFSVGSASVEIGPCPCAGVVEYEGDDELCGRTFNSI
jgi:3-oxoacyl-[acyl-carrier-protein] synthase-3